MPRPVLLIFFLLALTACAKPSPSDLVLARVNGEPITVERLEGAFTSSHRGHGVLLAGTGAVREFLGTAIDQELLIQEAHRIGAADRPEIVQARAALRAKRAGEGYLNDQVKNKVVVTDKEIEAVHARLGDRFQARLIVVASREDAERALARVTAGEEFGEVASQVSVADTASRGGDLGIVEWGRFAPRLEDMLWTLKKGETSQPFETDEGWNLLYVGDRTSVEPPKLEAVRGRIKATISQRKTRERGRALFVQLMKESGSTIDEAPVVAAVTAPPGAGPAPTTVVAVIGGEPISLERALKLVDANAARRLAPDRLRREVRYLLEAEGFRMLVEKEGLARGYGDRPAVQRELTKLTDDAALDYLLGKVILATVEVTDAGVEAYYRSHAKDFTEPEAIQISAILAESEDDARDIVREAEAGKDFKALAKTRSKDPALAASGGEIPAWITKGKLDPAAEEIAFSLKVGALGVAHAKAGTLVVRLDRRRPERLKPLDEVREQAREAALRERSRAAVKSWVAKLRQASTIEVDDAAIARAVTFYEASAREKEAAGRKGKAAGQEKPKHP
jgi:peptidyl-prolyl cis-trans isomerase C